MTVAHLEFFPSPDGKASYSQEVRGYDGEIYCSQAAAVRIGVIGELMILTGRYDPDQGWLDFMRGALITTPPPSKIEIETIERWRRVSGLQYERDRPRFQKEIDQRLAKPMRPGGRSEKLYEYDTRTQYVLPFWEGRACRDNWEYRDASVLWEKVTPVRITVDDEGEEWEEDAEPLSLPATTLVRRWCEETCEGRYYEDDRNKKMFFERYHDLFHCRIATAGVEG